jgi:hypothetical protein
MTALYGFAYREALEGTPPRSLGYRLLKPIGPEPWRTEVESVARLLQAAPYPEEWPPVDLFCSVLLCGGGRLIGVARYGLTDRTASQRRGGLELTGVIAPASLGVPSALAINRWLRTLGESGLDRLAGNCWLEDVLIAFTPVACPACDSLPRPTQPWKENAHLYVAREPGEPDAQVGMLEAAGHADAGNWQWLPLVRSDFPWEEYSKRGPLIAWTPGP